MWSKNTGFNYPRNKNLRGDLVEVFKAVKGYDNIDKEVFLGQITVLHTNQVAWSVY